MITRRDIVVGLIVASATLCVVALAQQRAPILQSSVFDWNAIPAKETNVGAVRQFFKGPTATLD